MTNWVRRSRDEGSASFAGTVAAVKRPVTELSEAENARLRRELTSAKLDLQIVKKAAYFARESR